MSEPINEWNQPVPAFPAELFDAPAPVTSVYLTTAGARPDAAEHVALRWKTLRRRLAEDGAPESALAEVDPLMERAHAAGETLVAIANAAGLLYVANLPELPEHDLAVVGPLRHLVPLLAATQRMVPHIVVATDRIGAELVAVLPAEPDQHAEVTGRELHISRSAPGGWSQRRFQQRAENRWEANAREVADELTRLVDATAPHLVVVSGDVRAVAFLREHVPARVSSLLLEVQGDYSGLDEALRRSGDMVTALVEEERPSCWPITNVSGARTTSAPRGPGRPWRRWREDKSRRCFWTRAGRSPTPPGSGPSLPRSPAARRTWNGRGSLTRRRHRSTMS